MKPHESRGVKCWGRNLVCGEKHEATHLLLNGGLLKVECKSDKAYHDGFLAELGSDIDRGVVNYISEQRTPLFRMHTDLDVLQPEDLDMDTLWEWLRAMQRVMRAFFVGAPGYERTVKPVHITRKCFNRLGAVVCIAPAKNVEKDKRVLVKTGVHVVWPFIVVDAVLARRIRKGWLQHFEEVFGARPAYNIWEDVFDLSIYTQNGLRMVGSDKLEVCPSCRKKKAPNAICSAGLCDGTSGKYPANRPYMVSAAVTASGKEYPQLLEAATKSGHTQLQFTCVRQYDESVVTPWTKPDWFDEAFFCDELEKHRERFNPTPTQRDVKRKMILARANGDKLPADVRKLIVNLDNKTRYSSEHPKCRVVQTWINSDESKLPPNMVLPEVYRNVEIVDMTEFVGSNGQPYYIARVDSYFCLNKAEEHQSSSIFFLINPNGLYQKCYCNKETKEGRKFGPCKTYKSSVYKMPSEVRRMLFPETQAMFNKLDEAKVNGKLSGLTEEMARELYAAKMHDLDIRWANLNLKAQNKKLYETRFKSKRK